MEPGRGKKFRICGEETENLTHVLRECERTNQETIEEEMLKDEETGLRKIVRKRKERLKELERKEEVKKEEEAKI